MKIAKIVLLLAVLVGAVATFITGNRAIAYVTFGVSCFNMGILFGEMSRK